MSECAEMIRLAEDGLASANVLFQEPAANDGIGLVRFSETDWVRHYCRTLETILEDLRRLEAAPETARRYTSIVEVGRADSIDRMNFLAEFSNGRGFAERFEAALFGALAVHGVTLDVLKQFGAPGAVDGRFLLQHGIRAERSLAVLRNYPAELKKRVGNGLSRLRPEFLRLAEAPGVLSEVGSSIDRIGGLPLEEIGELLARHDCFGAGRSFRYLDGGFQPVDTRDMRPVEQFFGYEGVRRAFAEHFRRFSEGYGGEPLLISSLPGLGKTRFTMAYTLSQPGLILILAGPEALERDLERLLAKLERQRQHRFVVFFDDIDPRTLDWYQFRTNIGGSLSMPDNVMVVLAANYEFPASILSRGRGVSFPVFDENRCQEMIEDFLRFKGLRQPTPELVNVIAADYTEEFGQKKFPELSPRTLMRYLGWYESDGKKRRRLLEQSKLEMIVRPDAQLFYEFNLKQLKLLYGEEKVLEAVRDQIETPR